MRKNEKKKCFKISKKSVFFAALFWLLPWFGFAFQRWLVKLEKVLRYHFKSSKMEKNWERSAKVFSNSLVFGAGPVYLTLHITTEPAPHCLYIVITCSWEVLLCTQDLVLTWENIGLNQCWAGITFLWYLPDLVFIKQFIK